MAIDILMYHSISEAGGPTSIPPAVFTAQMAALAKANIPVISIEQAFGPEPPSRGVAITFDDAFCDFAETAWPILRRHGFPAMVYVPTGRVGDVENWRGSREPARPIMDWAAIRRLAGEGVDFGSHTVSHPDLRKLDPARLSDELATSRSELEERLGKEVAHFAPPYGRSDAAVRQTISQYYRSAVGTRLGTYNGHDRYDAPRIEMFYFSRPSVWKQRLAGRGGPYLALRQALRALRDLTSHPSSRA